VHHHHSSARRAARQLLLPPLACLLVLSSGCNFRNTGSPLASEGRIIQYSLRLDEQGEGFFVEAVFPPGLALERLCSPSLGNRAGESLEWRGLENETGSIPLSWEDDGCFTIPRQRGEVAARYHVATLSRDRPAWQAVSLSPYADADRLVFPGEVVFLELDGRDAAAQVPSQVSIFDSDGTPLALGVHDVHSTLKKSEDAWLAPNNEVLIRSLLWLEDAAVCTAVDGELGRMNLVVSGGLAAPELAAETAQLVHSLEQWAPTRSASLELLALLPARWDRSARSGFARRNGIVLQVGQDALADPEVFRSLLSHELFHLYNGESLFYSEEDYAATTWFREGTTSYVSAVALVQSGLGDEASFMKKLAEHASNYLLNPVRRDAKASELDWRRMPYDHGVLLSLALDLILRDVSGGTRSLQGFWRYFAESRYWKWQQTNETLLFALNQYSGVELSGFFETYVKGSAPIPVYALLRNSGFDVSPTQRELAYLEMSVEYNVDRVELVVTGLVKDGVADLAGVQLGDVLVPLEGTSFDKIDAPIEFKIRRQGEESFVRLRAARQLAPTVDIHPSGDQPDLPFRLILEPYANAQL